MSFLFNTNSNNEQLAAASSPTTTIVDNITTTSRLDSRLNDGDIAMMIMATTFVMLQTPAMGIAQAGMIRRKNALSMLMQTLTGMAIGSVLWYVIGFCLVFGESAGGVIGNPFGKFGPFLTGLSDDAPNPHAAGAADTIPGTLLAAFQMMFALMVPVIVTGAWAERMTFKAFLMFIVLWPFFVYYPLAHWVWNNNGFLAKWGVIDFAGGITIHTSTGLAALAVTKVLEARKNHQHIVHQHHNLPLSTLGAALIWGGWYSFNGGSAYKANFQAAAALLNTHVSASCGAMTWVMLAHFETGMWPLSAVINGAFAGLAGITAGSGFVPSQAAFGIGILCATAGYFTVKLRLKLGLDDVCEVMGLQGAPGFLGSVLVGFAAKADRVPCDPRARPECCNSRGAGCGTDGLFFSGDMGPIGKQLVGASLAAAWAFGWTYVIMQIIARTVGCDVPANQEEKGLDATQIGELGYDHDLAGTGGIHHSHDKTAVANDAEKLCQAAATGNLTQLHRLLLFSEADAKSVDYDLRSPAHIAAAHGHLNFLKELQRYGCPLDGADRWNSTPLSEAISHGQDTVIAWLVSQGIEEKAMSLVEQLCEFAAAGDSVGVRRLLAAGVDVDAMDYDRRRGLHLAAAEGHLGIVDLLLRAGADADAEDRWGHKPVDDAQISGFDDCYEVLSKVTTSSKTEDSSSTQRNNSNNKIVDQQHGNTINRASSNTENDNDAVFASIMSDKQNLINDLPNQTKKMRSKSRKALIAERMKHIEDLATDQENEKKMSSLGAGGGAGGGGGGGGGGGVSVFGASSTVTELRREAVLKLAAGSSSSESVNGTTATNNSTIKTTAKSAIDTQTIPAGGAASAASLSLFEASDAAARELCSACASQNFREVQRLLKKRCDPSIGDYDGRCALHLCAQSGSVAIMAMMLESNPDMNLNVLDRYSRTPLEEAVEHRHEKMATLLRKHGGVIVNQKKGHALCAAAARGDIDALKGMKASGADLMTSDYDSRTALHLSASEGRYECLKWLLSEEGGNLGKFPSPIDRQGGSPLVDSVREGHKKCYDLLKKYVTSSSSSSDSSNNSIIQQSNMMMMMNNISDTTTANNINSENSNKDNKNNKYSPMDKPLLPIRTLDDVASKRTSNNNSKNDDDGSNSYNPAVFHEDGSRKSIAEQLAK